MSYQIEYLYLVPAIPILALSLFISDTYKTFLRILVFYLTLEWINSRYLDITLGGFIDYSSILNMFIRSLTIISFIVYNFIKIPQAKIVSIISLFIWLSYFLYEKIMIVIGTDTIEYDQFGNKNYLSSEPVGIAIGLLLLIIGTIFKMRNIFNPLGIIMLILGASLILYMLLFYNSSSNYGIRRRASKSEFYERKDLDNGIYN
tara:strand:+ start:638 stop:1246 length:609 start_codon:yes stop_codon:yes gene_type:complete